MDNDYETSKDKALKTIQENGGNYDEFFHSQEMQFETIREMMTDGCTIYGYITRQDVWSAKAIFHALLDMRFIDYLLEFGHTREEADIARCMLVSGAWEFQDAFQRYCRAEGGALWDLDIRNFACEKCENKILYCRFKPIAGMEFEYSEYQKRKNSKSK